MLRLVGTRIRGFSQTPVQTVIPRHTGSLAEIAAWLESSSNFDLPSLEQALRKVSSLGRSPEVKDLSHSIFRAIGDKIDTADPRTLARLVQRAVFAGGVEEEFFLRASEAAVAKGVNAFSPDDLSSLALGLAQGGVRETEVGNFLRREAQRFLPDLTVGACLRLLEAERRNFGGDRKFLDQLMERITDCVDRMTASDVTNAIGIFSKWGLGRGFLTRRLLTMTLENFHEFSRVQKISLLTGFAKLRFLSADDVREFLDSLVPEISKFSANELSELMLGLGLVGSDDVETRSVVRSALIDRLAKNFGDFSQGAVIDGLWGICAVTPRPGVDKVGKRTLPPAMAALEQESDDKTLAEARKLLARVMEFPVPKHRSLSLKLLEIGAYLNVSVNPNFRVDEAEKVDAEKAEISRMHAEFQAGLDSFKGRSFARGALIGNFRVDFYDERSKLAIDLDTLSRPTTRILRSRMLAASSAISRYVVVDYWQWRTVCRSTKEQIDFLQKLLA
jgi:hypothetical protein